MALHLLFFPLPAAGHILPMVDMVKLFAARGVRTTIVTTPANAASIQSSLSLSPHTIALRTIPFPATEAGLPPGVESMAAAATDEQRRNLMRAIDLLRRPFDQVLADLRPDCVVTDAFLPWTLDAADAHGIPRLVFHGTGYFALCLTSILHWEARPQDRLASGEDSVVVPGIPHRIVLLKSQLPNPEKARPDFHEFFKKVKAAEERSYGVVVNSFYELEPEYADHYKNVIGRKAWHVGPVSLCNGDAPSRSSRGSDHETPADGGKTSLDWLDSKSPGSVVYVCFGSMSITSAAQLRELAVGLEEAGRPFVWVVRGGGEPGWMPEGFEERVVGGGRGLIIRGWAPQILILSHRAVGAFVTHCGWNSTLEAVSAGVPMVTWPLFADQFYNERLIVDVLGVGSAVGVKHYAGPEAEERTVVGGGQLRRAVERVMGGGEEAEGLRRRAREAGEMARRAVEVGGSSYVDMGNLIRELSEGKASGKETE